MRRTFKGDCMICRDQDVDVRNVEIYTIGSEGTTFCHTCEMATVEFLNQMKHAANTAYRRAMLNMKKRETAR